MIASLMELSVVEALAAELRGMGIHEPEALSAARTIDQLIIDDTDGTSIAPSGQTGIATWTLGNDGNFVTLSAADVAVVYTPVNTFGSTGALVTPVVTALADQVTVVQQNNRVCNPAPPRGNGQSIAHLALTQGGNTVLLSQANWSDMASMLNTIGGT